MILPAEWRSLNNFSSQPIGTGPYSVSRNNSNQLKIRAFDDYFGYRALIDEVNVWVLPDLNEELSAGLTLEGPTTSEKAFESRPKRVATICFLTAAAIAGRITTSASGSAIFWLPLT